MQALLHADGSVTDWYISTHAVAFFFPAKLISLEVLDMY